MVLNPKDGDGNTFVLQVIADSSVMDEMEILVRGEI